MAIVGVEGLSPEQLEMEVGQGGRFVVFLYCISILVMTFKRGSEVHFVRQGESTARAGIGYTLITLFLGWWGIPWGPIYTIQCLVTNMKGGQDVTAEMSRALGVPVAARVIHPQGR